MKKQYRYIRTGILGLLLSTQTTQAQNTVTFRPDAPTQVINRNIYGHFAEHLGNCIYGGFYVGDTSHIPNTNGVRKDVIAALRKMKIPNLRWPGGCFADTYHWKDGIGAKDKRPAIVNTWWGNVTEDNSFGTHDFLNMCEELGAEPYLSGNVGSGTAQELADWVQYTNFAGKSPMSDLRQQNGRKEPWKVRYWGVGNEAWGCGGNMRPEYYADLYRKFATFMQSDWKNAPLFRIASGASDGDYNWTEVLMKNIPANLLDGVALHHYSTVDWNHKGDAVDFTEKQYFATMKSALLMDTLISKHTAIMDKYDPKKKIALLVDEWGGWYNVEGGTNPGFLFQQNTMRDAMIAGATLNIFNNHSDRVRMANLAQAINVLQSVILTKGDQMVLTPTYYVMEMYNVHQDATLIPVDIHSNDYTFENEKLPAVSASASKDKNGITHISLVNIDAHKTQEVTLDTRSQAYKAVSGKLLASAKLQNYNSFTKPDNIKPVDFKGATLKNNTVSVKLPPYSVVVLELK
ncbi:alpha-N-arabinofuranosidase [Chitinophaga ginsengisegetis]|uniref:alpha-N-arabinofuranosidase n=1 Tax=Chitinophaga ginsengisegetis TaxID=393003 RepID=UPI000DBA3098|nr:alpha-L-arabinofuranosidase C-terminal domain-containing protein [Chitinophaga ginsengisegetis]MDR6568339.1 alpha-N-arabinofuranosidase [Chitinophaga ginsengisegetis]MDR6648430.1 alpha-N-arabinofuranosidase [Chitinophaga ginsengisegetis]MDR6654420.1 alpha-N-arabinofuranosidase [Chitinophaga ginsengisegetis]